MFELGCGLALKFWNDSLGEHLAQFHTPLVKRINVPNHALREDAVFVKRDEFAENFRRLEEIDDVGADLWPAQSFACG